MTVATRYDANLTHNYHPLEVVVASGEGAWVTDVDGKRYLDCLAAYSAVNLATATPCSCRRRKTSSTASP